MVRTLAISILAIVASLLSLMNLKMTSGYSGDVPQGSDAMGLVIPLYGSIAAALFFIAATGLAVSGDRLTWIHPRPAAANAVAMLVAIGIGTMIVCAFLAWAETMGKWVAPLGIVGAGVAPLVLAALLLMSRAPADGQTVQAPMPRLVAGLLAPVAVAGLGLGAFMLVSAVRLMAERSASDAAASVAQEEERATMRRRSPAEAVRANLAAFDPGAPLWTVVGMLPEAADPDVRTIIIDRALKVPALNEEVAQTSVSQYPRYRYGTMLFIQHVAAEHRRAEWGVLVAQSIDATAEDIAADAEWFVPSETRNPDPLGFLRALRDVSALYAGQPELTQANARLKAAISALPASAARDSALTLVPGGGD